jgi:hypothetical protein
MGSKVTFARVYRNLLRNMKSEEKSPTCAVLEEVVQCLQRVAISV